MGVISRYWRLVRLDGSGQRMVEELSAAKAFFTQQFLAKDDELDEADRLIQQRLFQIRGDRLTPDASAMAEQCLRCFISHQIEQTCIQLAAQFGIDHGFTRQDLFPFVLDDMDPRQPAVDATRPTTYEPLSVEVLRTFDPNRATLSTWIARLVKHHRELNRFLLAHGVYLASDWAILNDTTPKQLHRILTEFHQRTPSEIQTACLLLESYHAIYRRDRLEQRRSGHPGRCLPPSPEQCAQMAAWIQQSAQSRYEGDLMAHLQDLAQQLRQYRIFVRGGTLATDSLEVPETRLAAERSSLLPSEDPDPNNAQEFLQAYRQQLMACLDQAIAQVTQQRLQGLHRKSAEMATHFRVALHLFHCQGMAMSEIAPRVALAAQYQVSRLLKLKEFRADVRRELLQRLSPWTLDQSKQYANPAQLHRLDAQVKDALDQQITALLSEAEAEASIPKNRPTQSLFAQRLCHHLTSP
ncbi:MAG: hypothetical protein WCD18_20780 [Thermosynechococcaceae cyanobacterium]